MLWKNRFAESDAIITWDVWVRLSVKLTTTMDSECGFASAVFLINGRVDMW